MTVTGTMVEEEFLQRADPFRGELMAHCYRMLGSAHDAEDLVQETYLRAWRAYHDFQGRSSLRTWLYRIATNACLSSLEGRTRRPLPTGLGAPRANPDDPLEERWEVPWLEPVPDAALAPADGDPAAVVAARQSVRLALVAALQHLPARQRAVLVLRDVLAWSAAEVAEALETSTAAVNSMLQRARGQLAEADLREDDITEPTDPKQRALLDRYARALEQKDVAALVELFTADARWEMPPFTGWYQGPKDIGRLVDVQCPAGPGELRTVPAAANGHPAFGMYILRQDGAFHPFQLQVVELAAGGISHVTAFFDLTLFPLFGLPDVVPG
jgi:RNA polymerase sigma-70 factor, ECF subfamily